MNDKDLERMQEDAELAGRIGLCVSEIVRYGFGANTLSQAQRSAFKHTDAGVHLAWKLDDGTFLYNGQSKERDPRVIDRVIDIGVGSVVEGSDAEVPLRWLDLPRRCSVDAEDGFETAAEAREAFDKLVEEVDAEACRLFDANQSEGN